MDITNEEFEMGFLYGSLSKNDKMLLCNGYTDKILQIQCNSQDEAKNATLFDVINDKSWLNFALSVDNRILIQTHQFNGSFWVIDVLEEKVIKVLDNHQSHITDVAFTVDGKYLITRASTETIIWSTANWSQIVTFN